MGEEIKGSARDDVDRVRILWLRVKELESTSQVSVEFRPAKSRRRLGPVRRG